MYVSPADRCLSGSGWGLIPHLIPYSSKSLSGVWSIYPNCADTADMSSSVLGRFNGA